jgi:glycosyltransferase involved in cell wall biosynthesis
MLDADALSAELAAAHVFVLPSLWGEPFGLATLEAMAHGLCPVVSDSGASPEIVRQGLDGRVVEAGSVEALASVLEGLAADEELRLELARSARERVRERYDHGEFIRRVEDELVAVRRRGGL